MRLKIHPEVIIRVPQFHLNTELKDVWEDLKKSICISSPEFYEYIRNVEKHEIEKLPRDIYHTVWKYYNRAKYRATPYGSFASFFVIKKASNKKDKIITIEKEQVLHQLICWDYQHKNDIVKPVLANDTLLMANTSHYPVGDNLRYLTQIKGTFSLTEIQSDNLIITILNFFDKAKPFSELKHSLALNHDGVELVKELINAQLLFTELSTNIIGRDYYARIGIKNNTNLPQYIIAERKVINGCPDLNILKNFPKLIPLLDKLVRSYHKSDLENFKSNFIAKFENKFVPVMVALDPELGIGYKQSSILSKELDFIKQLKIRPDQNTEWEGKKLEKLLLSHMANSNKLPIDLELLEEVLINDEDRLLLPNSIAVLASVIDGMVTVDNIGGASAVALAGRFSAASEEVTQFCRELISKEQLANPDVLFFDIAYAAEGFTDNINRRQNIYPFQLSILDFDTSDDPLRLDDMMISVQNGEVILFSQQHQKRLIPRFATAYNYTRSDLPAFRFLCDLQFQGLTPNLLFNLSTLVPGLKYYPRLQYKNIIISTAKWKVSYADLEEGNQYNDVADLMRAYLVNLGLPRFSIIRTEDRTMFFDQESTQDLRELHHIFKKFKSFLMEEAFKPQDSIVKDEHGEHYANQMLFSLTHDELIYTAIKPPVTPQKNKQVPQHFPIGSEWLYYEIFAHNNRLSDILINKLYPTLLNHKSRISFWFFIRYNEGGEHLRLRIRIKKVEYASILIKDLGASLCNEIEVGVISEFRLRSYAREIARYGGDLIDDVERHFGVDSFYVTKILGYHFSNNDKYHLVQKIVHCIKVSKLFDDLTLDKCLDQSNNFFLKEHQVSGDKYKSLNLQYRSFKDSDFPVLPIRLQKYLSAFESSIKGLLFKCPIERRTKLLSDLLHMHVNRLFDEDQRTHEMVIYYFLFKERASQRAFSKQEFKMVI